MPRTKTTFECCFEFNLLSCAVVDPDRLQAADHAAHTPGCTHVQLYTCKTVHSAGVEPDRLPAADPAAQTPGCTTVAVRQVSSSQVTITTGPPASPGHPDC